VARHLPNPVSEVSHISYPGGRNSHGSRGTPRRPVLALAGVAVGFGVRRRSR